MLRSVVVALGLALPICAQAGGLSLSEPNAAALGRAGAATALPDGASAVYYNPGALAIRPGLFIEGGVGVEHERLAITPSGERTTRTALSSSLPSLFISQRLLDHYAVGLGVYRMPSQALAYPDDFTGRFRVISASFDGVTLQPTVAGRPFSWLSIGFGLTIHFADLDLSQAVGDARYETRLGLKGQAIGLGGAIGLMARLYREYLVFGFSYKSAADLDFTGRATGTPPASQTPISVEDMRLTLPLPHLFSFALGSRPRPGTAVQVEARLGLLRELEGFNATTFAEPPAPILSMPLSLRELVQLRAGVEQRLFGDRMALRLGVGYDLGSGRRDLDPAFPDGDRVVIAAGLGYSRPDFSIDLGYLAAFSPGSTGSRGYAYPAEYAQVRHIAALTLCVRVEKIGPRPKNFD